MAISVARGGLVAAPEVGVDPALPSFQPQGALKGTLSAAGDRDMETVMRRWVAIFQRAQPAVEVKLSVESSATAPRALANGTAQFSFVGRKMLTAESALVTKAWGHEPFPVVVAGGTFDDKDKTHAEMIWVHPENPVRGLTLSQLAAVFGDGKAGGKIATTWGDLGLSGEWSTRPIHAVRDKSVGGSQYFKDTVLAGGEWNPNVRFLPDLQAVLTQIAQDKGAVGVAGLGVARDHAVRMVPIAAADNQPAIVPTRATVASREYPLSRLIYLYVNRVPGQALDPLVREFIRVVLSQEGQAAALADGHLPLSHEIAGAELAKLN